MDVSAKRDAGGAITDNTQVFGLQAPRVTLAELTANTATYGTNQQGALIYITDVSGGTATGQRVNINEAGYYSFDGSIWQKVIFKNIYTADGSLTGSENRRTLNLNGKQMEFVGSEESTSWSSIGALTQANTLSGTGVADIQLYGGNDSNFYLQQFYNGIASISATNNSTGLTLGTDITNASAPIRIITSPGGGVSGSDRMYITGEGNIGMNTNTPTEKLDHNGITRLRGLPLNGAANSIYTQSNGSASATQNQTFTATRTVVADANGVLGYVTGLPSTGSGTAPSGSINIGETVSRVYSVPTTTANANTFNLKTYITANGLTALPQLDGLEMNLQGVSGTYYDPRVYNVSSGAQLVSYQTFATQVNENETSLNNNLAAGDFLQIDANNIVFWTTTAAEVITTNLQVQVNATTYRWYEFKWWCMEVSGEKKIFLSVTRKG
ncbi:hypothetical protein ACFOEQ_12285 [Chryseobacterium arachidis]